MTEENKFMVPEVSKENALVDFDEYKKLYKQSIENPDQFWGEQAECVDWFTKWDSVKNTSFTKENLHIKWYEGGKLNVCYNCVDRHLATKGDQNAIIWEGDDAGESEYITYNKLHKEVSQFANVLKKIGVKKGDVVTLYMPMIPQAVYAMLACARIGAVHSVIFAGFSPDAIKARIQDCDSKFVITADENIRSGKPLALKANVDKAVADIDDVSVLVVKRTGHDVNWTEKDIWYHDAKQGVSAECPCEIMDAEDPLFILYTSGSTGTPKGLMHTTGGYLVYTSMTFKYIFDYGEGDIYWCTADVGWITGHSYIVYGPLANGATTLVFEGLPTYPDASRCWEIVDKHKVNIFYTAPTLIRMLMAQGDDYVTKYDRSSLRILGSVGEPISPEAWKWYFNVVGDKKCPIVDTWWQTETGGFMITPFPYATPLKAGSASLPFFGIKPELVDTEGNIIEGEGEGCLCITDSWPSQARTIYGDDKRFADTYFCHFRGKYFTGDGCKRDEDGYYWITGRVDDVINVAGHRIGSAELESVLLEHKAVAEAGVVAIPHDIKGQAIYVFVSLNPDVETSEELRAELAKWIKDEISPVYAPQFLQFAEGLPKTRSGKIMRRILRKIATDDYDNLGDTRTLLNPEIVELLIDGRLNRVHSKVNAVA